MEALAAPAPILARDNRFNRWVAEDAAVYFADAAGCASAFDELLDRPEAALKAARAASAARYEEAFTPAQVLGAYEQLLERFVP